MEFLDEFYNSNTYNCVFKYSNTTITTNAPDFTVQDTHPERIVEIGIFSQSLLEIFFKNYFLPYIWEFIFTSTFTFLIFILVFNRTSWIIKRRYKHYLRDSLFPKEHSWFGNNSPDDIYVSVKVYLKDGFKEHNLLSYFASAIAQESNIHVILGNAGEGKTFSLSRIALGILDEFNFNKKLERDHHRKIKNLVPIILNFAEIADSRDDDDIIDCIYNKICKVADIKRRRLIPSAKGKIRRVIMRYLSIGRFVILLDGYDEIANTESRLSFSSVLINFMREYEKCHYILTSRTQVYEEEPFSNIPAQNTLYLSPLSKEQVREFIGKWSFSANKSGTELYQRIINTIQLEAVAANPLLLTMIAHTYSKSDFSFSKSKVNLYGQCCACLLKNWEISKSNLKRFKRYVALDSIEIKLELLSLFAYKLYVNNRFYLKEDELLELWGSHQSEPIYFHGKSIEVLKDILNQSGLLEKTEKGYIRFRHRSFFEYFVALYMLQQPVDLSWLDENSQNEQNILFFYLSMTDNELIVTEFISKNAKYTKLIKDLLIERKIADKHVVCEITNKILESTNFEDIVHLQTLGYIAQQYDEVKTTIKKILSVRLSSCNNNQIKVNIIVGLMIFCDENYLSNLLSIYIEEVNIDSLVQYSGDILDDLAKEIIPLITSDEIKAHFIELLAKTYRFEAIYNIYMLSMGIHKDLALMGLLYMSREPDLLNWLESKKFITSVSSNCLKASQHLQEKYGWVEHQLSDSLRENLFLLIYLCKEIIKNGFESNSALIQNQITFLLSYIVSDEEGKVRSELVNIPEFEVKSLVELSYHWNKRKKMNRPLSFIVNGRINISTLNWIIKISIFSLAFLQMIIYLFVWSQALNLHNSGWVIRLDHLDSFAIMPFNSCYLAFLFGLFFINWVINFFLKKNEYGYFSILLTIMFAVLFSFVYEIVVQNITFRIISIVTILFVGLLEIIKHRNDYPSFKEPQYSKIIEYLGSDHWHSKYL